MLHGIPPNRVSKRQCLTPFIRDGGATPPRHKVYSEAAKVNNVKIYKVHMHSYTNNLLSAQTGTHGPNDNLGVKKYIGA